MPNYMAKNLLDLFGFPYISAPGEAEAECALLQQEGVVDAVLSDDVDTLMFGSTLTLRNWSSEGTRGNKNPTHVNAYHSKATKEGSSGLDRAGMILVALMSGGDYAPGGIPSCGPKIACEAARAGFGKDLCKISRKDRTSLNQWRERLEYELRTNESGFFRTKHRTLTIPEKFPDKTVLGYYTHPVVSSAEKIADLKKTIIWDGGVKVPELRAFTAEAFEWLGLPGAKKFIRVVAPALLVQKLWRRSISDEADGDNIKMKAEHENRLIKSVHGKRSHFITDGMPELRILFLPSETVGLDLSKEDTEAYLGMNLEDDSGSDVPEIAEVDEECPGSPSKRRGPSQFDPDKEQKMWIMETFAKLGVPLTVETWEEDMRNPKKYAARKAPNPKATEKSLIMTAQTNKLETYLKASKPRRASPEIAPKFTTKKIVEKPSLKQVHDQCRPALQELSEAASQERDEMMDEVMDEWDRVSRKLTGAKPAMRRNRGSAKASSKPPKATASRNCFNVPSDPAVSNKANPWTLSQPSSDIPMVESRVSKKHSASTKGRSAAQRDLDLETEKARRAAENAEIISLLSSPERAQMAARGLIPENYKTTSEKRIDGSTVNPKVIPTQSHGDESNSRGISNSSKPAVPVVSNISGHQDFSRATSHDETSVLSSQPLPPLPDSIVPRGLSKLYNDSHLAPRADESHRARTKKSSHKVVTLRESLAGAWKAVDEPALLLKNPKATFHGIEVIDLSED